MKFIEHNVLPLSCDWCPLTCGANRYKGNVGSCGADNKIYVANIGLHFWEEPPISGISGGPKRGLGPGSGAIFFSNCSMKCIYCQNYKISGIRKSKAGRVLTVFDLVKKMIDLQNQGAMNINFVSGTHYRSQIISAVRLAKKKGLSIPIVWNTSGYETVESIYALENTVDVWLTDFKYSNNLLAQKYSLNKINNYVEVALSAIGAMYDICPKIKFSTYNDNLQMKKGIIVRHLILPQNKENSLGALKLLFDNFENNIKYSIMNQYTPCIKENTKYATMYPNLLEKVEIDEYEKILDFADKIGIRDYYWQNGDCASDSFIPNFI